MGAFLPSSDTVAAASAVGTDGDIGVRRRIVDDTANSGSSFFTLGGLEPLEAGDFKRGDMGHEGVVGVVRVCCSAVPSGTPVDDGGAWRCVDEEREVAAETLSLRGRESIAGPEASVSVVMGRFSDLSSS